VSEELNPYQAPAAQVGDAPAEDSAELREVARGQKLTIYSILLNLASFALGSVSPVLGMLASLAAAGLAIYGVVTLSTGLRIAVWVRVVLALLMFVPVANLVTLVVLNLRATRRLRDAGYRIGLLGASLK
jgi:hypothetical protein